MMEKSIREMVLQLIDEERNRQIKLGRSDNNPWAVWLMILTDYFGRTANILWKLAFNVGGVTPDDLLKALIKFLAVGVAFGEHIIIAVEEKDVN